MDRLQVDPAIRQLKAVHGRFVVGRPARRLSESGHDGGWRLPLVAVANCEAADRSICSASAGAAVPGSLASLPLSNGVGSVDRGAVQGDDAGVCPGGHARPLRRAAGSAPGGRRKGGQQGGYKGSNFPKVWAVAQDQGPGECGGDGQ
jgi:hypothetical protein